MKLLDYIRGLRKGKEAHRLEKESMKDPFLADAMDGYQQMEGNHEQRIGKLKVQVAAYAANKRNLPKKRNSHAATWSIAASLVIGIGISTYFLFLKEELADDTLMVVNKELTPQPPEPIITIKDTVSLVAAKMKQDSFAEASTKTISKKDRIARVKATSQSPAPPMASVPIMEVTSNEAALEEEPQSEGDTSHAEANKRKILRTLYLSKNLIKGRVTDEKGNPIAGANVLYTGTKIGTVTNTHGEFVLARKEGNQQLTARYNGYHPVEIPVDTNRTMLIALNEDKQALSETTVVNRGEPQTPEPVIGKRKYKKYLKKNLIRPTDETCKNVQGKVTLTFMVDEEGTPQHIIVLQGLCESADKEAIRLIREGPKWTTGNLPARVTVQF